MGIGDDHDFEGQLPNLHLMSMVADAVSRGVGQGYSWRGASASRRPCWTWGSRVAGTAAPNIRGLKANYNGRAACPRWQPRSALSRINHAAIPTFRIAITISYASPLPPSSPSAQIMRVPFLLSRRCLPGIQSEPEGSLWRNIPGCWKYIVYLVCTQSSMGVFECGNGDHRVVSAPSPNAASDSIVQG